MTKRTRASKRATTTKRVMATATWVAGDEEGDGDSGRSGGWRATKRARATAARATATRARDGDEGDGNDDNVGDGDGDEGGG